LTKPVKSSGETKGPACPAAAGRQTKKDQEGRSKREEIGDCGAVEEAHASSGKDKKMKVSKKVVSIIIIAVIIVIALSFALPISLSPWTKVHLRFGIQRAKRGQVRLLCETDHAALLEACNELSRQAARGDLKPGSYNVRHDRHREARRFPQPILDLAPSYVYIDENDTGRVMVEMLGGLGHFGVEAYTEDYQKPSFAKLGDRELIPRLWYYDDGYDHNPEWDKVIDRLIEKHKVK
jgi:hypothetical protein